MVARCLVLGLVLAGASACGTATTRGVVPWVDRPLPLYVTPEPTLVRYPTSAPLCRPGQLRVSQGRGAGALGNDLEELVFTNTSTRPCLLRGYPTITAETSAGTRRVLRPQRGGTYFGQLVASDLRPGGHVFLDLATGVACDGGTRPAVRYRDLVFGLPPGGKLRGGHVSISEVCGLGMSEFGLPERYEQPAARPGTPGTLQAHLRLPTGIRPGMTLRYTVVLSNPTRVTVVLRPCPGYTQGVYTPTAPVHGSYALNCDSVHAIHPQQRVRYAMRLAVPGRARGLAKLGWSLNTPTGPFAGSALPVAPRWSGVESHFVILENGVVRTLDPSLPVARALAIAGDRIAGGVGTHETALVSPEVVDLGGRTVVPGFTDAHVHFPTWALAQRQIDLDGCVSLKEALARVRGGPPPEPGRWIRAYGWRSGDWSPSVEPTRSDLDAITGTAPAALISKDYHSLWLNSAALALGDGNLDVSGGVVERDEQGEPTGVLREEAAWSFKERFLTVGDDEYVQAMRAGVRLALSRGVTAVHDKDGWLGAPRLWQRLRDESGLGIRVWQSLPHDLIGALDQIGVRSGIGDDFLRIGYLKVFMDGTLGSQTALMLDGSGVEITSAEELADIIRRAARIGWPVAVHAIGDRANRNALDAFEQTAGEWRPLGLRHRIEHAQCLAPEDVARFGRIGVAASVQFSHAPSDRDLAERLWPDRLDGAYAWRSLLGSGAILANGSDAPIEELDPLGGIRTGVLRSADDRPAWRPEQAVTVEEALVASCVTPAWLAGDERRRGKLLPGYLADLVVLDRDPVTCPAEELPDVQVVATMVGGRWAHNPPPWD